MTCDFQQCGMCEQRSLRSTCAYGQSDQSLCKSLEYLMTVTCKLLTEQHGVSKLTGGCTGSSEYTLVKMPHCWKSHVRAQILFDIRIINELPTANKNTTMLCAISITSTLIILNFGQLIPTSQSYAFHCCWRI